MNPAITLEELMAWCEQSADFWMARFKADPKLLELPCSIDSSSTVQALVRHIFVAELRWAQRVAGLPVSERVDLPTGPLDALYGLHGEAMAIFRACLADPGFDWSQTATLAYDWLPPAVRTLSRRKMTAHALIHGQRHWAQLATLVREAGFPSEFMGDLLFNPQLV